MDTLIATIETLGTEFPPAAMAAILGSVLLLWCSYKYFKFSQTRFPKDYWIEIGAFCIFQFVFFVYTEWLAARPLLRAVDTNSVWSRPFLKQSLDLGLIHKGEHVRVLQKHGSDWFLIRFKDSGEKGYVETKHYEK